MFKVIVVDGKLMKVWSDIKTKPEVKIMISDFGTCKTQATNQIKFS